MKALLVSFLMALVIFLLSMIFDFVDVYNSSSGNDDDDADLFYQCYARNRNVAFMTLIVSTLILWGTYG